MADDPEESPDDKNIARTGAQTLQQLRTNFAITESILARIRDRASGIIGVDFGVHSLTAAVWDQGVPRVIANAEGDTSIPTFVTFGDDGQRLVGSPAKRQAITNPKGTIHRVRDFIGRTLEQAEDVAEEVPFEVIASEDGLAHAKVSKETYSFTEIFGVVLDRVWSNAADYLEGEVRGAVVAVPAYFEDPQKSAIREAGQIGHLPIECVISRPIAATLAYERKGFQGKTTTLCYDLSRDGFRSSVIQKETGTLKILSHQAISSIGGDSFNELLIEHIADRFRQDTGIDLREAPMALQRLKEATNEVKRELSNAQKTTVDLRFITATDESPQHLKMNISRSTFEELIAPIVEQTGDLMKRTVEQAGLEPRGIDEIVLLGRDTRIPYVRQRVQQIMGKDPLSILDPKKTVAFGAAVQGGRVENLI